MATEGARLFGAAPVERMTLGGAEVAVRTVGAGPPMLLVHGFPTHGFTWRELLPRLSRTRTCVLPDLPGLGDSGWDGRADLSFAAQAARLAALADRLDARDLTVVAHDTGATLARLLALARPDRVSRLALMNTEVPGHRPPWIATYQKLARLPGAADAFRLAFRSRRFVRSGMGLGAFYSDKSLLDRPEVRDAYVRPLLASRAAAAGALAYLRGIDWALVDGLARRHAEIEAAVLLLWSEDDPTFPVGEGEAMLGQFARRPRFVRIAGASLLPHEEKPALVADEIARFAGA